MEPEQRRQHERRWQRREWWGVIWGCGLFVIPCLALPFLNDITLTQAALGAVAYIAVGQLAQWLAMKLP
jgi:hypothetical protein